MVDLNLFDVLNVLWQHLFADSFRAYFYILGVFLHTYCDRIFDCLWMHVSISEYNLHNCMLSNHSSCTSWSYSILFYLILSYSIVFYLILSYPILFYLILRFWPVGSTCVSFKLLCHSKYFMLLVSEFAFSTLWHLDQVSPIDLECVRPCLIRLPLDISCPNTSMAGIFIPFSGLEVFRCAQWIGCHRQGPWKRLGSDCCFRRLLWALRLQIQWSARWVWLEGNLFCWSRSAQAKAQRRTCQWKISFSKLNSLALHFAIVKLQCISVSLSIYIYHPHANFHYENQDTQVPHKPIILYRFAGAFGLALSWGFDFIESWGCHVCAAVQIPRGFDSIGR